VLKSSKILKTLLSGMVLFLFSPALISQCDIKVQASQNPICTGDTISISATGKCGIKFKHNFNSGSSGGLIISGTPSYNKPCGEHPDSTIYLWMGNGTAGPRSVVTPTLNLSSGGCQMCFDMKYGVNGQPSPCEGPDAANQGVKLQYSTNGGITWVDIQYWNPNGGYDTNLTKWDTYCVSIPGSAMTANTKFRWLQDVSLPPNQGHWGLDNIEIFCNTQVSVSWAHGPSGFNPPGVHPNNSTYYIVTITEIFTGLTAKDSIFVQVNSRPNADFVVQTPICENDCTLITYTGTGSSSANYNWDFGGGTIVSGAGQGPYYINWNSTGSYDVKLIVSENGCQSAQKIKDVLVAPLISFYVDKTSGCEPLEIQITDNTDPTGATYLWNFGDGGTSTTANPVYQYLNDGIYDLTVEVTTVDGCYGTYHIPGLINVYPKPEAKFSPNPQIAPLTNPVIQFNEYSTYTNNWHWSFGDGGTSTNKNPSHTYGEGTYLVQLIATSDKGCVDSTSIEVKVIDNFFTIPNVFTPNGDGYNDVFEITNPDLFTALKLTVFNRWGEIVFQSNNYKNDWNGDNLSNGVYFYILQYETYFENGEMKGSVTIFKQ
jgi:gliding motility-associated-like protein